VGRTGTFITIDNALNALKHKSDESKDIIMDFIMEGRHHRPWFVETEEQFIFVYEYIWWYLNGRKAVS
jgi:protein tyrosine phosphatase